MLGARRVRLYTAIMLVIGLACIVPLSGCGSGGGGGGNGGGSADVTGRVMDDGNLNPVAGASVSVGGRQTTTTNSSGFFFVTGAQTGTVSFTINATMYDQLVEPRTLFAGSNDLSALPFFIPPARLTSTRGHIGGTVQTVGGANVSNASVNVLASSVNFTGRSKTDGSFKVYNVPFGTGSLSALGSQGEGTYGPSAISVDQPEESAGIIRLTSGPPPPPPF